MLCMSSSISQVKSNQNVCIIQLIILCVISHSSECQQGGCNLYLLPFYFYEFEPQDKEPFCSCNKYLSGSAVCQRKHKQNVVKKKSYKC